MKKVLFTLAALMMAGSLCAEEYMYIEDFEVSQELLAQTSARQRRITVPVKAHFDNYVSAWTVDLMTNGQENVLLPNMSAAGASEGADMTMAYIDELCNEKTITVGLNKGQNNTRFIAASTVAGYYWTDAMDPDNDDPVTYGANKWIGDYENMFTITFQFEPGFEGGVIQVRTQPASGQDPRGPITNGETVTKTFNITVEQAQVTPEDFVGTADVTFNGNIATISYTSNDPNATVEVTLNGDPLNVEFVNGVATYEAPTTADVEGTFTYTVAIKVTPDGENFVGEPVSDSDTYSFTMEKTATPVIAVVDENAHHCYFTVTGEGDVHVYVNGTEVFPNANGQYAIYAVEGQPVDYVITATAQGAGKLISDVATKNYHFDAWDGVDELVNGKTVAGVRYYNMAGQEMQQANGMTIVVTTYTDGTTSSVKVMK
jgi:hypothetical protein